MRFDLGDLVLDNSTRQLLRGGDDLRLSPKAFDFLVLLVRERPRIVTKSELHERLWPGVNVSDASIAMVASEVRAALGESARDQRRIRTAHGHGYAFQGDVRDLDAPASDRRHWLVIGERFHPLRDGNNFVGREPGIDVWVDSPTVSRRHACVRVTGEAATIEDLESKNGTFIGERKVSTAEPIANGEDIRFGSAPAVYRQSADATQPSTPEQSEHK